MVRRGGSGVIGDGEGLAEGVVGGDGVGAHELPADGIPHGGRIDVGGAVSLVIHGLDDATKRIGDSDDVSGGIIFRRGDSLHLTTLTIDRWSLDLHRPSQSIVGRDRLIPHLVDDLPGLPMMSVEALDCRQIRLSDLGEITKRVVFIQRDTDQRIGEAGGLGELDGFAVEVVFGEGDDGEGLTVMQSRISDGAGDGPVKAVIDDRGDDTTRIDGAVRLDGGGVKDGAAVVVAVVVEEGVVPFVLHIDETALLIVGINGVVTSRVCLLMHLTDVVVAGGGNEVTSVNGRASGGARRAAVRVVTVIIGAVVGGRCGIPIGLAVAIQVNR